MHCIVLLNILYLYQKVNNELFITEKNLET